MSARAYAAAAMQPDTPRAKFAAFAVASESTTTTYEIFLFTDGSLSCDGPDWLYQSKKRMDEIGTWRNAKRCKHTRPFEPYADDMLSGKVKVEQFGGIRVNAAGLPLDPSKRRAQPFTPPDTGPIETNLRKRFVRG